MDDEGSRYPHRITVAVTAQHLSVPRTAMVLVTAVKEAVKAAGVECDEITVSSDDIRLYIAGRTSHVARYWISNELWAVAARHKAGRRVKPVTADITAVYREDDVKGCRE